MIKLLALVPGHYRLIAAALAIVVAAGAVLAWGERREASGDRAGYQRGHAEYLALQAEMAARATVAEQEQRAEEARRARAQREIEDAHQAELRRLRADAAIADAAAGRLRQRVADLIAAARSGQAGSDTASVTPGPAADDAAGVLADVLGRCVARVRFLAAVADERGAAGTACEREYSALTP